ncbi:unannotated protein [freshwater metagenome]|uniref:Unannotated protein n=1 Tax=freshwater metagenome TaxID=449393 RepID=A0A6J5Y8Z0_9ZZZZ
MAALRLDAPDGEKSSAPDVDHVAAHRHCRQRIFRKAESPRADEHDVVDEFTLCELAVDPGETPSEWQSNVVAERERSSAGSTLATINGDEVRSAPGHHHALREIHPEPLFPNRRFDADR